MSVQSQVRLDKNCRTEKWSRVEKGEKDPHPMISYAAAESPVGGYNLWRRIKYRAPIRSDYGDLRQIVQYSLVFMT